ncbi:MAG: DNA repair protein RadC, partial [Holophagales bacterium]|nr:DNA repair protein RadC [Holophagales bacterium]
MAEPSDGAPSPRERLLRHGPGALTDAELIAVLVRAGRRRSKVVAAAERWIQDAGGLGRLLEAEPTIWRRFGLSDAAAAVLAASHELVCRHLRQRLPDRPFERPGAVADYVLARYALAEQEVLGAFYLDANQALLGEQEIFRGAFLRLAVEPRTILRPALQHRARSLLVWHTHPSGDPTPSSLDLDFTRHLRRAAAAVGLDLMDHLIIGHGGRWVSIARRGFDV